MPSEFALIDAFVAAFRDAAGAYDSAAAGVVLGPGDDAALLRIPADELLVATTDTLVVERHFLAAMPAACIGWRALAVNLSDLAAMGARPQSILVALTLPDADPDWLRACGAGMAALARLHGVALAGGNMSRGELALSVTALGSVPAQAALRRSGAAEGDAIYVSGSIGLGGAGLRLARARAARELPDWPALESLTDVSAEQQGKAAALARYLAPRPRVELGLALRGIASAAIDVSDGLLADLGHLCAASGVAATVRMPDVPVARGAVAAEAVRAGDDYELCFTVRPADERALAAIVAAMEVPLTRIGVVVPGKGVHLDGVHIGERAGYDHFG